MFRESKGPPAAADRAAGARLREPDRAEQSRARAARHLAVALGLVVLLSTAPAAGHLNLATAPPWARAVLLLAGLEGIYVAWMATAPDWSTVWVLMVVFAAAATVYAAFAAVAVAAPLDRPLPLGLEGVRPRVAPWCGIVTLSSGLVCYFCGRTSHAWRRAAGGR